MHLNTTALLREMLQAALAAADPAPRLKALLPPRPKGRVAVVGGGKASARMAQALEDAWGPCEGVIAVPEGGVLPTRGLRIIETSHPVPDERSQAAAVQMLSLAASLEPGDTLVALVSGGASALLAAPVAGVTLADKQAITRALLMSGAPIDEMNLVRQQFSAIKGGKLAAAANGARVLTFLVSDVPGDDPAFIGSGPTFSVPGARSAVLDVIRRYAISLPPAARSFLETTAAIGVQGPATDIVSGDGDFRIVASPQAALEAAAEVGRRAGIQTCILGDAIEGEAREVGRVMASIALQTLRHGQPFRPPVAYISGGETTVTVRRSAGKGGRCSEYLLSFILATANAPRIAALACDTDGRDGSETNAGAIWQGGDPFDRLQARASLDAHDAWSFFDRFGGLITTGPTHTNVNDFRVALVT